MKTRVLLAGISLAVLTPSVAMAADDGCQRDGNGRIIGTVIGAGAGGLAGHVIAGRGDKTEGTIIGGVIGAVIGNQVAKNSGDCRVAYGYYDKDGRWHATGVASSDAKGYFNRDGKWVKGRPDGYYDQDNRWVKVSASADTNGYWDRDGSYVPVASSGYYDRNNQWVSSSASGYYDTKGRWVAGPARGYYNSKGRWVEDDDYYASRGDDWGSIEQNGYYDENGRWRAGKVSGYYDSRGRFVTTRTYQDDRYNWAQMPSENRERISWMREYIDDAEAGGDIRKGDASYARSELFAAEKQDKLFRRDGRYTASENRTIETRLDKLSTRLDRNWRTASN